MSKSKRPLYYGDYLQLDRLLACQDLESAKHGKPVHDETLFIIVHQAYELWFKQILWELDAVLAVFGHDSIDEKDMGRVVAHLRRIVEIQRLLLVQVDVLETMTPLDFLDFRDFLVPASGIQSLQFRLIENRLGIVSADRVKALDLPYTTPFRDEDRERLERSEAEPSLLSLVDRWLARTPFLQFGEYDFWREYHDAVDDMLAKQAQWIEAADELDDEDRRQRIRRLKAQGENFDALLDRGKHEALVAEGHRRLSQEALLAALLINLYRDEPILHLPFRVLTHLMDIDEGFTNWRYRHTLMVLRMIGTKTGTAGTSGIDYLRETAEKHKVFTDLFNLATYFIPRSALPTLPPEVARTMSFQYSGK